MLVMLHTKYRAMKKRITFRSIKRKIRRLFTRENLYVGVCAGVLIGIVTYGIMQSRTMINPAAYTPLLNVIAKGESRGNYNAYFGNPANQEVNFTNMSLAEVLTWQKEYIQQGSPSNAVGRYQIIHPTLEGLITQLKLDTAMIFDEALQDRLAITLMEGRGSIQFIENKVSAEDLAHNLSKEWAALPRVTGDAPESSFYANDGLNKSQIDSKTILGAIKSFQQIAKEE